MASRLLPLLLGAVLALGGSSCATNPVTGGQDFVLMSESEEIALGKKSDADVRKQYGVYPDARLQAYVEHIGARLAAVSHRPGLQYRFTVLDSAEVNAFALPGGYVYITRGILAYLNSEAEVAAVLGHEIGHVTARHGVRRYTAAMATGVGASLLSVVVPGLGSAVGQRLLDVLGGAIISGYGREHELESDRLGAEYLARASYDPQAMIGVIGVLKHQEEFEKQRAAAEGRNARVYHGVFASHPSNDQRLQEVVGEANRFKTATAMRVARDEFLDRINGMVFGDSPREGIARGNRFYHRDLDIATTFPADFRLASSPRALLGRHPTRAELIQLEVVPRKANISPPDFLRERLRGAALTQESGLPDGRTGYSAVAQLQTPYGARPVRVLVLYHGNQALVFFGTARDTAAFESVSAATLATMASTRPLTAAERPIADGLHVRVVKARAGATFAGLAQDAPLNTHAEAVLRLLNDRYPAGEPRAAERIKLIE